MGVHNVMSLSLGEWSAIVAHWNRAHGKVEAPSDEEFDAAVQAAARKVK